MSWLVIPSALLFASVPQLQPSASCDAEHTPPTPTNLGLLFKEA